ncbi:MAG TPA: hypothetical protein VMI54_11995 [Polyangiaceae bacterium]|nr:hypothetical protein [Polyangiaceae bacterium]
MSLRNVASRLLVPGALACTVGCGGGSQGHGAGGGSSVAGSGGSQVTAGGGGSGGASQAGATNGGMPSSSAGAANLGGMSAGAGTSNHAGAGGVGGAGAASGMGGAAGTSGGMTGASGLGGMGAGGMAGAGALVYSGPGCSVPLAEADEPMLLSQTGCVDPSDPTKAVAALVPYDVNSPLWSDGASKERYISLPTGAKIHVKDCTAEPDTCKSVDDGGTGEDEGHWDLPVGTTVMKVFSVGGARVETRLLMHYADTEWRGYSFEWNDAGTDATLLSDKKDKMVGSQSWHYPSRSECLSCHNEAAGRSLGPMTQQLNRDYAYADGTMNIIDKFQALGAFDQNPTRIAAYPSPTGSDPLESRARSYLQANCSLCHRPGSVVEDVDLRFTTSFADTLLCNQAITQHPDDTNLPPIRLVPGDPADSNISFRMHSTIMGYRMPEIASSVVDTDGTMVIDQWIQSITSCP